MAEEKEKDLDKFLKLIAKSSVIVFVSLILSKIFTYAYRIIIARSFGPEVYGLFSLAIMILGWFIAFSSLGLSEGLLRYVALYRGEKKTNKIRFILKTSITIIFFSTIISAIILFLLSEFISINLFHNPSLIIFLKIFSILIPLGVFSNIFLSVIRAYEKINWHAFILNILQNAIKLITLGILIILGFKTNAVIFSYFLGVLIVLIASYLVCRYKIPEIFEKYTLQKKIQKNITKELFSYSWPVLFLGLLGGILYSADSFVLGYFKSTLEVGFYNAAVPIALLLSIAPQLFTRLFFPLITREYSRRNIKIIKGLSQQVGKWIFILNFPFFIIMVFFPGVLINILFGKEYLIAENALRILAIGAFFSSLATISSNLILMMGKTKIFLINLISVFIFNITLNIILIPKYGLNGAAFSTMLSGIILSFVLLFQAHYYTSIWPLRRKMLRIFIVTLIPIALLRGIKQFIVINNLSLILMGLFFFLSYVLLIFLTGCLDKNDFMILRNIKKKIIRKK
ncbi:flippase [Candidatus Pacearchaeota archaeon]|nr:flippase [Candidatus Pacearchaeota archaeon]